MSRLGSLDDPISPQEGGGGSLPDLPVGWTRRCSAAYLLFACALQKPPVDDYIRTTFEVCALDEGVGLSVAQESVDRAEQYLETVLNGENPGGMVARTAMRQATIAMRINAQFAFGELLPALERLAKDVGNIPEVNDTVVRVCRQLWESSARAVGMPIPGKTAPRPSPAYEPPPAAPASDTPVEPDAKDSLYAGVFFLLISGAVLGVAWIWPSIAVEHQVLYFFSAVVISLIGWASLCIAASTWLGIRLSYTPGGCSFFIGMLATIALVVGTARTGAHLIDEHDEVCRLQWVSVEEDVRPYIERLRQLEDPLDDSRVSNTSAAGLRRPYLFLECELREDDTPDLADLELVRSWREHGWGDLGRDLRHELHEPPPDFMPGSVIVIASMRHLVGKTVTSAIFFAFDPETLECTWRSKKIDLDDPWLRWRDVRTVVTDLTAPSWYVREKERVVREYPMR